MAGRWLKIAGGTAGVIVLLLGIGWFRRDAILESTLENQLRATTGVGADIERLETDPFQGELVLKTLTLDNPKGFSSPYALKIERLELALDPNTLLQETVVIHSLTVSGIEVKLEQKLQKNNLAEIVGQAQETAKPSGSSSGQGGGGSGKEVKITKLALQDISASMKLSVIGGLGVTRTLEIEDVTVTDITSYNAEGKLMEALTAAVTVAVLRELANPASLESLLDL